jgi:uncharacterized repeat protein (TIGR03803 family)
MKLTGWIAGLLVAVTGWLVSVACAAESGTPIHIVDQFGLGSMGSNYMSGPLQRMVEVGDGEFYGVTFTDTSIPGVGAAFKVSKNGQLSKLTSFSQTNGYRPRGGLMLASDGYLYGYCTDSVDSSKNYIFRMTTNGAYTVLHALATGGDLYGMHSTLTETADGSLYGTFPRGGGADAGTLFRLSPNGQFTNLIVFSGIYGAYPGSRLVEDGGGLLYGSTASVNGTIFRVSTNGAFANIFTFGRTNGFSPAGDLTFGHDGLLYGVTSEGGAYGLGTVFKLTTNGILTTLVHFDGTNGARPICGLVQSREGFLYGTTFMTMIGTTTSYGTIFRLTTNGMLTTLAKMDGTNATYPIAELIQARNGAIYGAFRFGAAGVNGGTVLRFDEQPTIASITANGTDVTLKWHSFSNRTYRLESKSLTGDTNWTSFGFDIPSQGNETSFTVSPMPSAQRVYRVALLP